MVWGEWRCVGYGVMSECGMFVCAFGYAFVCASFFRAVVCCCRVFVWASALMFVFVVHSPSAYLRVSDGVLCVLV